MDFSKILAQPDGHLSASVAAGYDRGVADRFEAEALQREVDLLAELAGDGPAVEFAVGTGRLALPLAQRGVAVHGIDFSGAMLSELAKKPGATQVLVTQGDMTSTRVCEDAALVYLVFNTIMNLRTQDLQKACFRNAATHLRPGGRFLVETGMPKLRDLPPGKTTVPFVPTQEHLGFDEYPDFVNQILVSHHKVTGDDGVKTYSSAFRYVWPSELDLMAELAGMSLEARWEDWKKAPFTGDSPQHVSIWRKAN